MKDFLENELSVGDKVVFTPPDYKNFCLGTIVKITAKQVAIEYINTWNYGKDNTKTDIKYEYPDRVVKKVETDWKHYSAWGEEDSEHPNCLVAGTEQPKFASGELDVESSKFYYTFVSESWEAAMEEFNRREYK